MNFKIFLFIAHEGMGRGKVEMGMEWVVLSSNQAPF